MNRIESKIALFSVPCLLDNVKQDGRRSPCLCLQQRFITWHKHKLRYKKNKIFCSPCAYACVVGVLTTVLLMLRTENMHRLLSVNLLQNTLIINILLHLPMLLVLTAYALVKTNLCKIYIPEIMRPQTRNIGRMHYNTHRNII